MKVKDLIAKLSEFDPKSDVKIVTRELRYNPDRIVWVNFDHEYNIDDIIYGYYREDQE